METASIGPRGIPSREEVRRLLENHAFFYLPSPRSPERGPIEASSSGRSCSLSWASLRARQTAALLKRGVGTGNRDCEGRKGVIDTPRRGGAVG
jgi:hypothetical protein